MRKIFITLVILLSTLMLNSKTFNLENSSNFTLLNQKDYSIKSDLFAFVQANKLPDLKTDKDGKTFAKRGLFYANLSPGLLPGIALGYGWSSYKETDKKYYEAILFLRNNSMGVYPIAGIGILVNLFNNPQRKGFYYIAKIGVDYIYYYPYGILPIDPGGCSYTLSDRRKKFAPNVAIGLGYSIKIYKTSFLRFYMDIGIKYVLINLNTSFIF